MIDYLVVARDNAYGLTRDSRILVEAIGAGAAAATARSRGLFGRFLGGRQARTVIHVERVHANWISAGEHNLLVPNQERFPRRHIGRLARIDRVLAKSRHAEAIFGALGVQTDYLGFTSPDRLDPEAKRDWSRFFHLAGGSTLKGTADIVAAWAAHPHWPELVLVQKAANAPRRVPPNVTLMSGHVEDAALRRLQNVCGLHLCPSRAEGWGHHIVEALSVGAVTVTTDAAPMNEHVTPDVGLLLPVAETTPRHLGLSNCADPRALAEAVERLIAMSDAEKAAIGRRARRRFEQIDAGFAGRVRALL